MKKRKAFTLIELMLALSLIVVATALIGSLMQMYARNFATRGEDIRRMQLARSILNMIAEDLRAVVTVQEYDASVLQQQLGSSSGEGDAGGGSAGGGSAGGGSAGGGSAGGGSAGGSSAGAAAGGATGASASGTSASGAAATSGTGATAEDGSAVTTVAREPGLYGTQFELTLDVSRLPRGDEYIPAAGAMVAATLTDVPGDIKTVTYFVQAPSVIGVGDTMDAFNDPTMVTNGMTGGLVRRALDRAIIAYAEETGDSTRLMRTGELIAPEVVSLEFAYFDGTQWLYTWDSTTQALPWLVQITLSIQSATGEAAGAVDAGVPLSAMTSDQQAATGVQVYELIVAIPGAQLKAAEVATEADSGMSSMGLP